MPKICALIRRNLPCPQKFLAACLNHILNIPVLSGVAYRFPKKKHQFFKWKSSEFYILKYSLLMQAYSLLRIQALSSTVLLMCLFVCICVTCFCMWIILYSFIMIIIISRFIHCSLIDLFTLNTTWFCRRFFEKDLRLRCHRLG